MSANGQSTAKQGNFELKSQLHGVLEILNTIPEFEAKKAKAIELISALNMKETDKRKMLGIIQYQKRTSFELTRYLYDALLTFEGLGSVARKRDL